MSSKKTTSGDDEGTSRDAEALPGTSTSVQGGTSPQRSHSTFSPDDDTPENSPVGSVKVRNVMRERPAPETRENKRARISQEDDVQMDTDGSEDDDDEVDEVEGFIARDELDLMDSDQPDSLPVQDIIEPFHSRRSSSNAEENVTTTMQSSSPRQRFSMSGDPSSFHYNMDNAIASTSTAALAPPLSRMMENSPLVDDMHTLPTQELNQRRSVQRDTIPAPTAHIPNMEPLYFQRNAEVAGAKGISENRSSEIYQEKMHGKHKLMWARKLFFLSTELVFPGFTAYSDNRQQMPDYMGVRVRSSCMMQGLLYADSLFFIAWALSFLSNCDILVTVLKELHGYLSVCLTCLFIFVNIIRLRFGLKGNENDEVQYLALFWMITVIVQIPLFAFILLTDLFCPVLMAFTITMDGVMMVFILLESIVGFIHFRNLLRDEMNVIKMTRRSKEVSQSRANLSGTDIACAATATAPVPAGSSNIIDLSRGLPHHDSSSSDEDEMENEHFVARGEGMDFQMHIQRLSETQRIGENDNLQDSEDSHSDSSEQVTSTSDTIRRRPIIAH